MSDLQWLFVEALAGLVIALSVWARDADARWLRHPAVLWSSLLLLLGAAYAHFGVVPGFIHADLLGPPLMDQYLDFPAEPTFRPTHGQFGYFALGAIATAFGGREADLFFVMQGVGLVDVALIGLLAMRYSGSHMALPLGIGFGLTHPVLLRVGGSEDVHAFGLLLALAALVAVDSYAVARARAPLVVAVVLLGLLVHTRQSFYLFVPFAPALAMARGGRELLRDKAFLAATGILATLFVERAVETSTAEGSALPNILAVVFDPHLAPAILENHVLVDLPRFGPSVVAFFVGIVWAARAGSLPRVLLALVLANFVATYPCGFPSPGVEFAQRLPVFGPALVLGAWAIADVLTKLRASRTTPALAVVVALSLLLPPVLPGSATLRQRTTDDREFHVVMALASSLPPAFTLVVHPSPAILRGASRYAGALRRRGKRVRVEVADGPSTSPEPRIFLEGVECWSYTFTDLTGSRNGLGGGAVDFAPSLFAHAVTPIRPPSTMREECRRWLRGSTPVGPTRALGHPIDDPPFLYYAVDPVPVRFHRLASPPRT